MDHIRSQDRLLQQIGLLDAPDLQFEQENLNLIPVQDERREILIMTIEIGNGKKDKLVVYENDSPRQLAKLFCAKHVLNSNLEQALVEHIKSNVDVALQEQSVFEDINDYSNQYSPQDLLQAYLRTEPKPDSGPSYQPQICAKSRQLAKSRSTTPVHERLHNISKNQKSPNHRDGSPDRRLATSPKIREASPSRRFPTSPTVRQESPNRRMGTSPTAKQTSSKTLLHNSQSMSRLASAGNRLYHKGLMAKQKADAQRIKKIEEQKAEQKAELTFRPQINNSTNQISRRGHPKPEDELLKKGKKTREQIEQRRIQQAFEEKKQTTFAPKTNARSEKILSKTNRSGGSGTFNSLYIDANRRQAKLHQISSEQFPEKSFHPDITLSQIHQRAEFDDDRIERLVNSKKDTEEYLQQVREAQNVLADKETGQPYFMPAINETSKKILNNRGHQFSYEQLYSLKKKQTLPQPVQIDESQISEERKNSKSDQIYAKTKERAINELYQSLNPDIKGEINADKVDVDQIDRDILSVISPLLIELEELGESLTYLEFYEAMENLICRLTPGERQILLKRSKNRQESPVSTSNANNSSLMSRSISSSALYERTVKKQKASEAKLKD